MMLILSRALILFGGLACFCSILFRTPEAPPFASLNPRHWKPVWRRAARQSFRSPGYMLTHGGLALLLTGVLIRYVVAGWPW
jgi:uncharacterized protein YjeT (DUF2065 family)